MDVFFRKYSFDMQLDKTLETRDAPVDGSGLSMVHF